MRILIALFMASSLMFASDLKVFSKCISTEYITNTDGQEQAKTGVSIVTKYKLDENNVFTFQPAYFHLSIKENKHDETGYVDNRFFINNLYWGHRLSQNYSIYTGIFHFGISDTFYRDTSTVSLKQDGIQSIINLTLAGVFVNRKLQDGKLTTGLFYYKDKFFGIDTGGYMSENNNHSYGFALLYNKQQEDNIYNLNFYEAKIKYADKDIANLSLLGLEAVFNNIFNTSLSFYNVLGISYFRGNTSEIKDIVLQNHNITTFNPDTMYFGKEEAFGYSILTGLKAEVDIKDNTYFYGVEYYKTSPDYVSLSYGYPISAYGNNVNGDKQFIYAGMYLNRFSYFTIRYCRYNKKYTNKIGSVTTYYEDKQSTDNIYFGLYYKF